MIQLIKSISSTSPDLVIYLYGTHGNEAEGALHVAQALSSLTNHFCFLSDIIIYGPVEPWCCEKGFRYDATLSDPNRIVTESKTHLCSDVVKCWELWRRLQPTNRFEINKFIQVALKNSIDLQSVFQTTQTNFRGFIGYADIASQTHRLERLVSELTDIIKSSASRSVTLIDVHTGIGPDACTHLFYSNNPKSFPCRYLVDYVGLGIAVKLGIDICSHITETGVIDNKTGMIDCFAELAHRTYGFTEDIGYQRAAFTSDWISKASTYSAELG